MATQVKVRQDLQTKSTGMKRMESPPRHRGSHRVAYKLINTGEFQLYETVSNKPKLLAEHL